MLWFLFASLAALFTSLKDIFGKKSLQSIDPLLVCWGWTFFTALCLMPLQFIFAIPVLGDEFWMALVVDGVLNAIAFSLYMKAIGASDLSVTLPMIAFTPIFMLLTSPIIVGEWPSAIDGIGVVTIVAGSYLLNLQERSQGYLAPFQALLREPGPKLTLFVAFLWSITSNFDKIGVQNSSPLFWSFALFSAISLLLSPLAFSRSIAAGKKLFQNLPALSMMGLLTAFTLICQMQALQLTLVVQVIAIKRTSILMGVLWGKLFFQETGIRDRLSGTVTMLLGVFLITFF